MKDFIELHDTNNKEPIIIGTSWIAMVEKIDYRTSMVRLGFIRDKRECNSRMYEIQVDETYDEIKELLKDE